MDKGPIDVDDNTQIVNCEHCGFPVRVDKIKIEQHNAGTVSMLLWAHRIVDCASCNYKIVGQIVGFDPRMVAFTWVAIEPPQKSGLAVPNSLIT